MLFYRSNPPPTNHIFTLVQPFSFVWYVIPLLKTGALASTRILFLRVDNEKTRKKPLYACLMASIGHNTHPMAASSGFYQSPGPPPSGNVRGMVPAYCCSHQNGQQSWSIFLLSFCLLLPLRPLGRYGVNSCSMAASSGFWSSPGHAALGKAICIAPAHRHGHKNGQRRKNFLMPLSILSLTIALAKDHVMVHWN